MLLAMGRRPLPSDKKLLRIPDHLLDGLTWTQTAEAVGISRSCLTSIIAGKSAPHLQDKLQPRLKEVKQELRRRRRERKPDKTKVCTKCERRYQNTEEFFPPFTRPNGKRVLEARCRSCKKNQNKRRYIDSKLNVMRHYSGGDPACACCGETKYEFLSIDHVNGGGQKHRAEIKKGSGGVCSIHIWLERNDFPEGFQILCLNCNGAIGFFGYCPHQGRPDGSLIDALI